VPAGQHLGDVPEGGDAVVAAVATTSSSSVELRTVRTCTLQPVCCTNGCHPVDPRVVAAGLRVAREGDEIEPLLGRARRARGGRREDQGERGE
jgi:hypothetical protein